MCFEKSTSPYDAAEAGRQGSVNNNSASNTEVQRPSNSNPSPPVPSPVRQGIRSLFGNVNVGFTDEDDNLIRDPNNPYQNFMENFRNSPGQKFERFGGDGGIKNFFPSVALFNALRGKNNSDMVNMTDATDRLSGQIFRQAQKNPDSFSVSDDGLGLSIDTGTGTINLGSSGFATYTGMPNEDYTGVFKNIVNPPKPERGDGPDQQPSQQPFDPCPEGFKFDNATQSCQPVANDTVDPDDVNKFVKNTQPMPNLSRYGRDGGEYLFFSGMPGVPDPMKEGGPPKQPTGQVTGPGGPMDDLVGPIMLSNKEYVLPAAQVLDEGDGDYDRGIRRLDKQRLAALKKYKSRFDSA